MEFLVKYMYFTGTKHGLGSLPYSCTNYICGDHWLVSLSPHGYEWNLGQNGWFLLEAFQPHELRSIQTQQKK